MVVRRASCHHAPIDLPAETSPEIYSIVAEEMALRRVATLVARGISDEPPFGVIVQELARVAGADAAALLRYEPDEAVTLLAAWNAAGVPLAVGEQEPVNAALRRLRNSARPVRCGQSDVPLTGPFIAEIRQLGIRATVAVPIVVDGRVGGVCVAASLSPEPFPAGTDSRMVEFAELVAIGISSAESRAALVASRTRVIAAADESRRQTQRDLHDGALQGVVNTILCLKLTQAMLEGAGHPATQTVNAALESAQHAAADLGKLGRGVMPSALRYGDLCGAVNALVRDIDLPVSVEMAPDLLSMDVTTTAYFVIAEAVTNAVTHARATRVDVRAVVRGEALELEIRDDGVGGAHAHHGTGLVGLIDRVESIGGQITIVSPLGGGTTVAVSLPAD